MPQTPLEQSELTPDAAGRPASPIEAQEAAARRLEAETGAPSREIGPDRSAELMKDWETSDALTRSKILERVGREAMARFEAPPPELHVTSLPENLHGSYDDANFRMTVNETEFDSTNPKDALETYLHEYRHAEQSYLAEKVKHPWASEPDRERAEALRESSGANYQPGPGPNSPEGEAKDAQMRAYQEQYSETDAESFGVDNAADILRRREAQASDRASEAPAASDADTIGRLRGR